MIYFLYFLKHRCENHRHSFSSSHATSFAQVGTVAGALPSAVIPQILRLLAETLGESPHMEFLLQWVRAVSVAHGKQLEGASTSSTLMPALRSLQKVLNRMHEDMASACESNIYTLEYLTAAGRQQAEEREAGEAADEG